MITRTAECTESSAYRKFILLNVNTEKEDP
jgi:hypothetical protein